MKKPVQVPFIIAFDAGIPIPVNIFTDLINGIVHDPALIPEISVHQRKKGARQQHGSRCHTEDLIFRFQEEKEGGNCDEDCHSQQYA